MNKKILVVDDNESWRETLVEMLEQMGHQVIIACDGGWGHAEVYHGRREIDFIIGPSLLLMEYAANAAPWAKRILISASPSKVMIGALITHGSLTKPVDFLDLLFMIEDVFRPLGEAEDNIINV